MSKISDIFEEMWKIICFISKADNNHIVYDSYIEGSIKDCERVRSAQETDDIRICQLNGKFTIAGSI